MTRSAAASEAIAEAARLLRVLAAKGFRFVVLRGHEFLADSTLGLPRDIDVLIHRDDSRDICAMLVREGYEVQRTPGHIGCGKLIASYVVAFDFQPSVVTEKSIPYLPYEVAAVNASRLGGIPVLSGAPKVFHLVIHSLIGKGRFSDQVRAEISRARPEWVQEIEGCVGSLLGRARARRVTAALMAGDYPALESKKWGSACSGLLRRPWLCLPFVSWLAHRCRRRIRCGSVVAIIGLDGSGKTTISQALVKQLSDDRVAARYLYMGRVRGHALPMHTVATRIGMASRQKPRGWIFLHARELAYYLDQLSRYAFFILPRLLLGTTVVCDRYAYDLLQDRHAGRLTNVLLRYLFPRAGLLVFLSVDEETIIQRKDEYGPEKRHFLLDRLTAAAGVFGAHVITSGEIEDTVRAIRSLMRFNPHTSRAVGP